MTEYSSEKPGQLVQIINSVLQCPFAIYVESQDMYDGIENKYHARITVKDPALRDYCKLILEGLGMFVFKSLGDPFVLRARITGIQITELITKGPSASHASKFEARLKRIFDDITFDSTLTDSTIEYVAAVRAVHFIPLLQVLDNMGIDDWEAVDDNKAIAFSLSRIQDIIW